MSKKLITIDNLAAMINAGFKTTAKQEDVDKRFDAVDERLINLETDVSYLKARILEIGRKLDYHDDLLSAHGAELKAHGKELKVQGSELKAQGSELKAQGSELKAQGSELKAQGKELNAIRKHLEALTDPTSEKHLVTSRDLASLEIRITAFERRVAPRNQ